MQVGSTGTAHEDNNDAGEGDRNHSPGMQARMQMAIGHAGGVDRNRPPGMHEHTHREAKDAAKCVGGDDRNRPPRLQEQAREECAGGVDKEPPTTECTITHGSPMTRRCKAGWWC